MKYLTLVLIVIYLCSCTANSRARNFGGKEDLQLEPDEILINITWKEDDMWVLTEDTLQHIKHFRESSSFGVWNGEVTIKPAFKIKP